MYNNFTCKSRILLLFLLISFCSIGIVFSQSADFTINNTSQCLTGNSFVFTNTSSAGATAYQWNFSDGTTSTATNPTKTYSNYGTYSVQLIATIGGINYYVNKTVEVNAEPQCSFTYYAATGTGNSYSFQSTSSIGSGSIKYSWDFGDGATASSSNPSHTYLANGTYTVTLTVTSDKGCTCSTMQTVVATVSSGGYAPNLSFSINNNSQCVTGNNFSFTNTTATIAGATYRWTFGDGGTSNAANPSHSYASAGSYTVGLIATIASVDYTYSQIVNVTTAPTISIAGTACSGSTLTATTNATNVSTIQWKNGASVVQTNTPSWNATYSIVAGNNGAGTNANQLQGAKGIYVDKAGNVYVIDNYQSRVQKWAVGATTGITVATGLQITGVGVDDAGNVYTVDDINNWVQKWTAGSLTPTTVAGGNGSGNAANQLNNPRGNLYIDASGNIYINDVGNNRIQKWAVGAVTGTTVAGGNGAGSAANQFNFATAFFVDASGNIYVADVGNYRIQLWTVGAVTGTTVAGGNGNGSASNQLDAGADVVYVDAAGNIYAADRFQGRIQLWTPGATAGTTAFGGAYGAAPHDQPFVFMNMNTGDIFILDQANNRVVKYTATGSVGNTYTTTTAGNYTATVTTFGGCTATSNSVLVNQTPIVYPIVGANNVCANTTTTFVDTANLGGTWSSSNTNIATINASGVITGVDAGTATITYTVNNAGCTTSVTKNINVFANPTLNVIGGGSCASSITASLSGGTASFLIWSLNGTPLDTVYNTTNTTHSVVGTGTYTVDVVTSDGCNSTASTVVSSVGVTPNIQINTGISCINTTICAGSSITFNSSITNGGASPTIQWKINGSNVATGASFTTSSLNNNDVVTAVLTSNAACPNPNPVTSNAITMQVNPLPSVTISGSGCTGNALSITGSSIVGSSVTWYLAGSPVFTSIPVWDTVGTTVAGMLSSGSAANQLNSPSDVFIDANDNIYVCDIYNNRIQKFPSGSTGGTNATTVAGGNGNGYAANQLQNPYGFTLDASNNLYITNSFAHSVELWLNAATSSTTIAGVKASYGSTATLLQLPKRIAIDKCGNIYVADSYNHRVQKFVSGSNVGVTVAGGNGNGSAANQLSYPTDVSLDDAGNLYVCDNENHRIQKFAAGSTSATNGVTVAGGNGAGNAANQLNSAWGFTTDGAGNILVADTYNNRVMYWAAGATTGVEVAGGNGYGTTGYHFNYPTNVALDKYGNFYVADEHNNRVQKFVYLGMSSYTPSVAGTYTAIVTNNSGCSATSNAITVTNCVTPTISIASASGGCQTNICAGVSTTFTASTTNIGSSPTYQWKVNGNNTGTNSSTFTTSSLNNNDIVTCDIKNNDVGAYPNFVTSNSIAVTVNALPTISLSGSNCINNPITVTTNSAVSSVVWTLGGATVSTASPSWNSTGITVAGGSNGSAANQLRSPTDVLVDNSGNIYVADLFNNRIQKFPSNSTVGTNAITVAGQSNGTGGSSLTTLNNPHGFTVDAAGNVYITNSANHRVDKWLANAANGVTVAGTSVNGSAANQLFIPRRMVLDGCGNMYITDTYNHRVQKWAVGATSGVTVAGGNGQGNAANQLKYPTDVALDAQGNIYVADADNHRVQKFPPNSTSATNGVTVAGNGSAGSGLNQLDEPQGIYVDATGNLFVADANNVRIMYWANGASTGVLIAGGNGYGTAANQLNYPTNVTLDKYGNLYVADEHNDRIQKFTVATSSYTPTIAGTYTVTATNNNGCVATQNVTINSCVPNPAPSFTTNSTNQCITANNFVFTNTSTAPSGTTYLWNFGDGTTSTVASPTHTYATSGYYNVQMMAIYNGQNYYANSQSVYVGPLPVATFTQYYNSPLTYTFNSTSTISSGSISSFAWNFGDGGTATISNPQHTFASAGTYNVTLTVTSDAGCTATITTAVVIAGTSGGGGGATTPTPSFTTNSTNQCITSNSFVFTNTSTAPTGTTYLWNFGDGTTSTVTSPTHTYTSSGYYNVQMMAIYNGQNYYANSQSIYVGAKPVASFNVVAGTGSGNAHTFISTSTIANGSMSYAWDFGDGTTSTLVSPQHIYSTAGTVNVKLVVTSDLGCKDSITQTVVICPILNNQAFTINAASSCFVGNYFGVQNYFGNTAGYPMTYLWNYGDGFTTTAQNPAQHSYAAVGTYTITLTTTLSYPGCAVQTGTYSLPVTVQPMPVAAFNISGSPTTMCYSPTNNYTFNNTSSIANGSMSFAWDFGDTTSSSLYSPSHAYTHAGYNNYYDPNYGEIPIKLIATSNNNCKDSITKVVTLYRVPTATKLNISQYYGGGPDHPLSRNSGPTYFWHGSYVDDTISCFNGFHWYGHSITGNTTAPNDMFIYNYDNGTSDTTLAGGLYHGNPYHRYTSAGTHPVSAYILSSKGCTSNVVNSRVILTPNADTLPHSIIGLHPVITTNVGIDPFSNSYNHYKFFIAHLGSTACRPIIASDWLVTFLSGTPYWNHSTIYMNTFSSLSPLNTDSAYFAFDADTTVTYQIRLITMNDLGMRDTAYATVGATNGGYTNYSTRNATGLLVNRNIGIFPNPASRLMKVAVKLEKNYNTSLIVYNSLGQKVLTTNQYLFGNTIEEIVLHIESLVAGNYYLQLQDNKGNILLTSKFIKTNY